MLGPAQGHATMGPKEEVGLTAARGACVSTLVSSRRTTAGPGGKVHGVSVTSYASNIDPQVRKAEVRFTCRDTNDVSEGKCLLPR